MIKFKLIINLKIILKDLEYWMGHYLSPVDQEKKFQYAKIARPSRKLHIRKFEPFGLNQTTG